MNIPIITEAQLFENLLQRNNRFFEEYYALYSSWFGGIITDPHLMLLPIDDHIVHRGDGVFEAMKIIDNSIYLLDEHLKRLFTSAEKIGLTSPYSYQELKDIVIETARVANQPNAIARIFLSRGPGNFSVNPYDSISAQLYVIIHKLHSPAPEKYQHGVKIGKSHIAIKSGDMAQIKSCNYLVNVLMKKEAVDRNLDFVIGVDEHNNITESATENIIIIDSKGMIVHPLLDSILKGITMTRVCELAREKGIETAIRPISVDDLISAREVMMTGTTLNILPVIQFEDKKIADGKPGDITKKLNELLVKDITPK